MEYAWGVVWVLAILAGIFVAFWIFWVSILVVGWVPVVGYVRIRRLGYSPPAAATLVLGVMGAALLSLIGTAVFLPGSAAEFLPGPDGIWGYFKTLACIGVPISLLAFGCAVLARKLPRRDPRVSGPRRVRFPFISLGYLIIAAAIALGPAAWIFGDPEAKTVGNAMQLFVLVALFYCCGRAMIKTGTRLRKQISIEEGTRSDPRLPVVFLRPFVAERMPFVQGPESKYGKYAPDSQKLAAWAASLSDADGNRREEDPVVSIRCEYYLGGAFRERIGPFIALGNPEDYLPPEGAIRTYAEDEGWYEYFERLAGRAVCMVMPASSSSNLQRELTFLRREGLQQRLFIFTDLMVPKEPFYGQRFLTPIVGWVLSRVYGPAVVAENLATWGHLAENLGKLGFNLGDDPGRGAVVTFDSEGKAKVLVRGAETPFEFVDPIRDYLVRTFGLDLGGVAAEPKGETILALDRASASSSIARMKSRYSAADPQGSARSAHRAVTELRNRRLPNRELA